MDDATAEEHLKVLAHHLLAAANTLRRLHEGITNNDYDDEWYEKCEALVTLLRDQAEYFSPSKKPSKVVSLDSYQKKDFDKSKFWSRERRSR